MSNETDRSTPSREGAMSATEPHRLAALSPLAGTGVACGALVILGSILPWANVDLNGVSDSVRGVDGNGILTIVLGLVASGVLIAAITTRAVWPVIAGIPLFAAIAVIALIAMLDIKAFGTENAGLDGTGVKVDGKVGLVLVSFGAIVGIAVCVAALVHGTFPLIVVGVIAVGALAATNGPFTYINFIESDDPKEFTVSDVTFGTTADSTAATTAATSADTTAGTTYDSADETSATTGATTAATGAPTETTAAATIDSAGADGTYTLTSDSQAGYRVVEVLFGQDTEGVGRTNSVTGSITIGGTQVTAAEFTVDVATLKSDEDRRDAKFKGEIMDTSEFPTATFVITEPIELGSIPADDAEVTATATGELTLHGVTKSVTLEVTAKKSGTSIAIAGSTDVVFSDYDIDNPSTGGITTEDHGLIEFLLVAVKA